METIVKVIVRFVKLYSDPTYEAWKQLGKY